MKPPSSFSDILSSKFNAVKNYLYKHYGEEPGKMLVHTGVLSWTLSAAAQVMAVVFNDKISSKEKMFLIPQECADAAINILSFYLVTNSFTNFGVKLVKSGKLTTPKLSKYIKDHNIPNIGKLDTDISKGMTGEVLDEFKGFKNGVSMITNTVGSIVSCNLLTPILRNEYAARKQKEILQKRADVSSNVKKEEVLMPRRISLTDYQQLSYTKFSKDRFKV